MTTPAVTERAAFEPAPSQLERANRLRRFNRIAVYFPVALVGIGILVVVGLLLWGALSPRIHGTREFASALADIVIILTVLPVTLLCAIVPVSAIAFVVYRQQGEKRPHGRLQPLFWRLEMLLLRFQRGSGVAMDRLARPVIAGHGWAAFVRTLLWQLKKIIKR
jgi:hypothetical protein